MSNSFDEIDGWIAYFPKPVVAVIRVFRSECIGALKMISKDMGLVSREDFMAQKKLLKDAQEQIEHLEKQLRENKNH